MWLLTKKASFVTFFGQIKGESPLDEHLEGHKRRKALPRQPMGGGGDRHLGSRYYIYIYMILHETIFLVSATFVMVF